METKIYKIKENEKDLNKLKKSGEIIKKGGLVAFPTETVYGLGGDALNCESSKKIYKAKGRPSDNPLIVHVGKKEDIKGIVSEINDNAQKLIDAFFPGPITLIMKKNDRVPLETTGGLDTVGIRMPYHKVARDFILEAGGYVAAPSANVSGRPSPTLASHVKDDLEGKIDAIIDDGKSIIGLESTIVDTTVTPVEILRPGYITREDIKQVLGECKYDDASVSVSNNDKAPKAPGMKYKHYAPKGEVTIVGGKNKEVRKKILKLAKKKIKDNKVVGIIATDKSIKKYKELNNTCLTVNIENISSIKKLNNKKKSTKINVKLKNEKGEVLLENYTCKCLVLSVGSKKSGISIAQNVYKALRIFDDIEADYIYCEDFSNVRRRKDDKDNIGIAIMNRLNKAAGGKKIVVE